MSSVHLAIFPIVEGEGETRAMPKLLFRLWREALLSELELRVLEPYRLPKGRMLKNGSDLEKALNLGRLKLADVVATHRLILLQLDADDDCENRTASTKLGPSILSHCVTAIGRNLPVLVSVADRDYESWLIAGHDWFEQTARIPGKGRLKRHFGKWSEVVDQSKYTTSMNLALARERAPSLERLVQRLEEVASH